LTPVLCVLIVGLLASLVISLVVLPLCRFEANNVYAAVLAGTYVVFMGCVDNMYHIPASRFVLAAEKELLTFGLDT